MKRIFIIISAFLFVVGFIWIALSRGREQRSIGVASPAPASFISSPLAFQGEARGGWFFEGSFPVRIEDSKGVVLGRDIARATGDWMTSELIPFSGTILFSTPTTDKGTLIFDRDNPSGLPENGGRFEVPVQFFGIGAKTPSSAR